MRIKRIAVVKPTGNIVFEGSTIEAAMRYFGTHKALYVKKVMSDVVKVALIDGTIVGFYMDGPVTVADFVDEHPQLCGELIRVEVDLKCAY